MEKFFKLKENETTVSTESDGGHYDILCDGLHHCGQPEHR